MLYLYLFRSFYFILPMPETVLMFAPPGVPFVLGLELVPWLGLVSGRSLKLYNYILNISALFTKDMESYLGHTEIWGAFFSLSTYMLQLITKSRHFVQKLD